MSRSRSLTRFTIRVGLPHLGQSVLLDVSITFLRSAVFAILVAISHLLSCATGLCQLWQDCGSCTLTRQPTLTLVLCFTDFEPPDASHPKVCRQFRNPGPLAIFAARHPTTATVAGHPAIDGDKLTGWHPDFSMGGCSWHSRAVDKSAPARMRTEPAARITGAAHLASHLLYFQRVQQ